MRTLGKNGDHCLRACFNNHIFTLVEEVHKPEARKELVKAAQVMIDATSGYDDMPVAVQDMVAPVRNFAMCVMACLSPEPFASGATRKRPRQSSAIVNRQAASLQSSAAAKPGYKFSRTIATLQPPKKLMGRISTT